LHKSEKKLKSAISPKLIKFATWDKLKRPHYIAKGITAVVTFLPMIVFHIVAAVELVQYRDEVLRNQDVPAPSTISLFFTLGITIVYLVLFFIIISTQRKVF